MTGRKVESRPLVRWQVELIESFGFKMMRVGMMDERKIGKATGN